MSAPVFKKRIIRCWVDVTSQSSFYDTNTNSPPSAWNGCGFQMQIAFGIGSENEGVLINPANLSAVLAKIWQDDISYIEQTYSKIDTALTIEEWNAGVSVRVGYEEGCHVVIDFLGANVVMPLDGADSASFKLTLHGATSDAPTDPDGFARSTINFKNAGIALTGPIQSSNIVPALSVYDGGGECVLATVDGVAYIWTQGTNDTSVENGVDTITDGSLWVAVGSSVTLHGTPGEAVTAQVWYPVALTVAAFDAMFSDRLGTGGGNGIYHGDADPNGSQSGTVGDEYKQIVGGHLVQTWTKCTGIATDTGWE